MSIQIIKLSFLVENILLTKLSIIDKPNLVSYILKINIPIFNSIENHLKWKSPIKLNLMSIITISFFYLKDKILL